MTLVGYILDQEDAYPDNTAPGPHKLVYVEGDERRTLARFVMEPEKRDALLFMCYIANEGLKSRGFDVSGARDI